MVDTPDLKSVVSNGVPVRVRPAALYQNHWSIIIHNEATRPALLRIFCGWRGEHAELRIQRQQQPRRGGVVCL